MLTIPENESPTWVDVPYVETTDRVMGGIAGPSNASALALTERTDYLKQAIVDVSQGSGVAITDIYNDINLHGNTFINMRDAIVPSDPVTLGYLQERLLSVVEFGAVGDGITNDGPALNLALDALRTRINAVSGQAGCVTLDLAGKTYVTNISLNATALSSWGWAITNGTIIGKCANKIVLDLTGSRGGRVSNIVISGDSIDQPKVGMFVARTTGSGQTSYCDNTIIDNVSCIGYYSLAAGYFYGQETTTYLHCRWWNYNKQGYAAVHTGYTAVGSSNAATEWVASEYQTVVVGSVSYINNKYINCDYRYLPTGQTAAISAITKANGAIVTAAGHPFTNGMSVVIGGISSGMTQINNLVGVVASATANDFVLTGVDSTAFSTYTSGGTVIAAQSKPTVFFGRGEQHRFDTCYIVNYGSDSIEFDFPDSSTPKQITMDMLFEGIGSRSHVRFLTGTTSRNIFDFELRTYNTHARDYMLSTNASGTGRVVIYNGDIVVTNHSYSIPVLLSDSPKFAMYGTKIVYPASAGVIPGDMTAFRGSITAIDTGNTTRYKDIVSEMSGSFIDPVISSTSDGVFTPTVSSSVGTIASYTATGTRIKIGKFLYLTYDITITDNGTGSGFINLSIPVTPDSKCFITGRDNLVSGRILQAYSSGTANFAVYSGTNEYPVATGSNIVLTGIIPVA